MGYKDELFQEMRNNPGKHLDISAPSDILSGVMMPATSTTLSREPASGALPVAGICPGAGERIRKIAMNLSWIMWEGLRMAAGGMHSGRRPGINTWSALKRRGLIKWGEIDLGEYGIGGHYVLTDEGKVVWANRPDWMRKWE